jgi:hypothetical protein
MIYFYKITDLKSGKVHEQRTLLDEYSSYRDFISYLERMNEWWSGLLRYEESREPIEPEKKFESLLTSEYDMV